MKICHRFYYLIKTEKILVFFISLAHISSLWGFTFCSIWFFFYRKQFPQYGVWMIPSKLKTSKSIWKPKHTWTEKFCCLAEPSRKTPTTAMLEVLTKGKLAFGWFKSSFQLFRALSGRNSVRELSKIPVEPCGYTIPWLKFDCNISSCCVYVVPYQIKPSEIKAVTVMIV